ATHHNTAEEYKMRFRENLETQKEEYDMFLRNHIELKKYKRIGIISLGLIFTSSLAAAESPKTKPDDSWISVNGTVVSVEPDSFVLDYGKDTITVEMDDGDRDADAYKLLSGDKVRVTGKVDDDLFEKRTIEASSVYVEKLNTSFYVSAIDEEDIGLITVMPVNMPVMVSETVVEGTITQIPEDDEFIISTGTGNLRVETEAMPYNPLDHEGYQQLDIGDRVSVNGEMDYDFLEGREFVAKSIVTLKE
ncbi:MAG: NirD/YgiW/YdeI family stress tolerance protein, partial [Desulforhopalus sp.]